MAKLGGMLFGGVFAAVGIGMAGYCVLQVHRWVDSSSWVQTPVTIDALELRINNGDGTTYGVDCEYHYIVNEQKYVGDRASFYSGSDNFGRFHQDLHARLKKAKQQDNAVAWIDPDTPEKSVLDRSFRCGFFAFSQLFALVFGAVGIAISMAAFFTRDPSVQNRILSIDSSSRTTRGVCFVLMFYCGGMFLLSLPVALLTIFDGQFVPGLICLLLTSAFGGALFGTWRGWRNTRHLGRLLLPTKDASRSESAKIILPANWQGPIDMDVRWTIPRPPSNQIGVEDELADTAHVDLPTTGGTVHESHIPLELPVIAHTPVSDMPVKVEVKGTIGGYRYSDVFEVPATWVKEVALHVPA